MLKILYTHELNLNAQDLGIEVTPDAVRVPEELRRALESMGVRTADALAAALQSFPTAVASQTGMDSTVFGAASAGALQLLRPHVDPKVLLPGGLPQRRGMGAMPPRWAKMSRGG